MKPVRRSDLVSYVTWTEQRSRELKDILDAKRRRRVSIGDALTLMFENRDTVRWQVQEMMRIEQMMSDTEIDHELATYNELLGGAGELGATLMVEIDDPEERARRLAKWRELPGHIFLKLEDGTKAYASFDPRQVGEDRLSAVQFLKFKTAGMVPVSAGVDLPDLQLEVRLTEEQQDALRADLR
ncbi:MAG TPA: DUF3501 family protein [Myxococcales bacterium]|jgi:hypothetical protein